MDNLMLRRRVLLGLLSEDYIVFADSTVESILLAAGIGDGVGIKPSHAAAVTSLRQMFYLTNVPEAANISTFDELQYFTGLTDARDFMGGSSVTKVTFPSGLVMGSGFTMYMGLRYCASLEDLDISDMTRGGSILSANQFLFTNCTSLTTLRVKSIESLIGFMPTTHRNDDTPFYYNTDTHYVYVDGVELTTLVIPSTVTEIRPSSFYRFNRVTSVTIPNTVIGIGNNAFKDCSGITGQIVIPSTVTSVGDGAFAGCSGLTNIYIYSTGTTPSGCIHNAGSGTGLAYIAGNCNTTTPNIIPKFTTLYVAGNFILRAGLGSIISNNSSFLKAIYIIGNIDASVGTNTSDLYRGPTRQLEYLYIGGTCPSSNMRGIVSNSNAFATSGILHLGYNGIAGPADKLSASSVPHIYVGDGSSSAHDDAILAQYLADTGWSTYSSKLDTWYNYVQSGGEYATPPTIPTE